MIRRRSRPTGGRPRREQFDFIKATTEVDYGTGLRSTPRRRRPSSICDPAGPTNLGGVFVPVRSDVQGAEVSVDPAFPGKLEVPLATDRSAAHRRAAPDSGRYVRTRNEFTGISTWEKSAAYIDFEIGLHEWRDPNTGERLNRVDLKPATAVEIGGLLEVPQLPQDAQWARTWRGWEVITPAPPDAGGGIGDVPPNPVQPWSRTTGRWVAAIPEVPLHEVLYARRGGDPATWEPFLPFEDVPADPTGQQYSRQHGNWHPIPPPSPPERPAGKTEPEIGIVFVPDRSGLAVDPDGGLWLEPATNDEIGGLHEVPGDGKWVRKTGTWEQLPPAREIEAGIGLEKTGNVIDLQPPVASDPVAGIAPEIGGVYGTPRSERNGIVIDSAGHISAPLATADLAGTIIEPVADAKGYVSTTQLDGTSQWVPPASTDMATNTELGTVRVPARNDHNQGLNLDNNGFLLRHRPPTNISAPCSNRATPARCTPASVTAPPATPNGKRSNPASAMSPTPSTSTANSTTLEARCSPAARPPA